MDDAWISVRVAMRIAEGGGHRFNAGGPVVDAVTPLGWEYVLAPFARGGPSVAMYFAKWLGAALGVAVGAWLGARTAREPAGELSSTGRALRWAVLLPLALSTPFGAWCASGMETGVVVALATVALASTRAAPLAAGLAAAWRPELLPWAVTLSAGRALAARRAPASVALAALLAVSPAILVAAARTLAFGEPAPLAVWAKPSDLDHGAFYALAALIWTGAPVLVFAPWSLRRLAGDEHAILIATGVHLGALTLAGGDWMALFRLFVPVLPGLFWVGVRVASVAPPWATATRVLGATLVSAWLLHDQGGAARGVMGQRTELVRQASSALVGARHVATLDVGWVGMATSAEVVDLAGVTDPTVARLAGGHTSKRIPPDFLGRRAVDAVILLFDGDLPGPWTDARWARVVEARLARQAAELGFVPMVTLELSGTSLKYVVLRLRDGP